MRKMIMSFGCLLLTILLTNNAFTQIPLSGDNEVPAVTTTATGEISVAVDSNKVTVTGSFSGLSGKYTASHIHGEASDEK